MAWDDDGDHHHHDVIVVIVRDVSITFNATSLKLLNGCKNIYRYLCYKQQKMHLFTCTAEKRVLLLRFKSRIHEKGVLILS